jgi:hypothetical protein
MHNVPRCQTTPLASHQTSVSIDDREILRWNFGDDYARPFFFPVVEPSGVLLTRMGHLGSPDHDHHLSIWFAHYKVMGIDFWGNAPPEKHVQEDNRCVPLEMSTQISLLATSASYPKMMF